MDREVVEMSRLMAMEGDCLAAPPRTMSVLSWNYRRLGNLRIVRALQEMIASKDPSLVFLMETKLSKEDMTHKKCTLGFTEGVVIGSIGSKGGLALLWKKNVMVDVQTLGPWHINAEVGGTDGSGRWRFTGFYGQPETSKREKTWQILERLGTSNSLPWLCIGDYNEILSDAEKLGGNLRAPKQMERFREAMNKYCNQD